MAKKQSRVLIIAGSDSGGGAGIQGDIKTVTCLGGYASTAITCITAQNTQGVLAVTDVSLELIHQQISAILEDIGADAVKTGMLHSPAILETVATLIAPYTKHVPLVVDPVMQAKGGAALLEPEALTVLQERLIPLASLVTPNIPEAEKLSGMTINNVQDMKAAGKEILQSGARAVLVKGGHFDSERSVRDVFMTHKYTETFKHPRIDSIHTHGTGCTLASAITTGLAQGLSMVDAIKRARAYVFKAIQHAPQLGKGHGPLMHNHTIKSFNG